MYIFVQKYFIQNCTTKKKFLDQLDQLEQLRKKCFSKSKYTKLDLMIRLVLNYTVQMNCWTFSIKMKNTIRTDLLFNPIETSNLEIKFFIIK